MRIELCAGGIGGISVADFQTDMRSFLSEKEAVIASFKAVSGSTSGLSGGVGSLQGALDDIQSRIIREETALEDAKAVQTSMNDFLELAQRVDAQVASDVNRNKEDFYGKYPELRPAPPEEEKAWYEKAWEALCGAGEAIKEAIKDGLEFIADTLKKAWDGLVEFYNEHKKIIDTVLLIVGAIGAIAAVIATGGLALAPLLGALGLSASVAAAVSTAVAVVAVVSTVAATALNVADVWLEIDNPIFNAIQTGLNITSAVTNFAYSIGNLYNSFKGIDPQDFVNNSNLDSDISISNTQIDTPQADGSKPYQNSRPAYGKDQIDEVWENAKDPVTGKVYDPSGKEITWDPSKPRNGQWDMGHIPGEKYHDMHTKYMNGEITKEQFLEWYRDPKNYRPELPRTNRGHKYE